MKIELTKETKIGEQAWYAILVDGKFKGGKFNKGEANELYKQIKNELINKKIEQVEILKSEEF